MKERKEGKLKMLTEIDFENEWISKFDIYTGKLKGTLSNECFEWAQKNNTRTSEIEISLFKGEMTRYYFDMIDFFSEWLDIPEDYKKILSIWIIGTYFHKEFETFPYIYVNAMRGTGKSRLLRIVSWLQKNGTGQLLNNPSDSVMFRTAQERGLVFDEFESEKSKDKQMMREILNSCYKKDGVVYRIEKQKIDNKEKMVAVPYPLYTPIIMANINGIEEVLSDRAITLIIEKSMNPALVKKIEDFSRNLKIKGLKSNLSKISVGLCNVYPYQKAIDSWNSFVTSRYNTHTTSLHTIQNSTSLHSIVQQDEMFALIDNTGIFGRNLELFFPLLLVADSINKEVFDDLLKIFKKMNTIKKEEEFAESKDVSLMEFVAQCEKYRYEMVFSHDLFKEFREFIGSQGNDEESRWLNLTWFGIALKRLNLVFQKKRVAKGQQISLNIDHAKEKIKIFKTTEKDDQAKLVLGI